MPDCSNENGTVLERQFLLRGLFAEILSGRALCHEERGPWPLGSRGDVVASPDLKSGSGLSSNVPLTPKRILVFPFSGRTYRAIPTHLQIAKPRQELAFQAGSPQPV